MHQDQRASECHARHPLRTLDMNAGIAIDRYVNTQDSGEFLGKGHENLAIREWAYLPDLLRRIHDQPAQYIGRRRGETATT